MAERSKNSIHVGQMNLRIPGSSAETAHRVADGIARGLARGVPSGMYNHLGAISIRVRTADAATDAEMSNAISDSIATALQNGNRSVKAGSGQAKR
ncbi:MAG TPA: hypothetical protein VFO63_17775 [Blastocatellia bacterium]|nr:hypothetical protein [Blastocatellia bacterium]